MCSGATPGCWITCAPAATDSPISRLGPPSPRQGMPGAGSHGRLRFAVNAVHIPVTRIPAIPAGTTAVGCGNAGATWVAAKVKRRLAIRGWEREKANSKKVYRVLASRKPVLSTAPSGRLLLRLAERRLDGPLSHDPPRNARSLQSFCCQALPSPGAP